PGPGPEAINELYFQHPLRWRIMNGDTCIGSLTWRRDHRSDDSGDLVVAAADLDSQAVPAIAWSVADELDARFQPCSQRFIEIQETVRLLGERLAHILLDDGKTLLAELLYCGLNKDEEYVYFFEIDPETFRGKEGLCRLPIARI